MSPDKSQSGGTLCDKRMTRNTISKRVHDLAERIGIDRLSAHDCRHYWATRAVAQGTTIESLRDAGGWASFVMPARYIDAAKVANEHVSL